MRVLTGAGAPPAGHDAGAHHAGGHEAGDGVRWVEHLRVPDLSVGTYHLPAGAADPQRPHTEDEIYVVTAGRARIVTPDAEAAVGPGSVIYVPAGEEHRFVDVTQPLTVLVVFAPAERRDPVAQIPSGTAATT
ncbi:MAG TPA: cupin domain-containing protein [Pilimelia sp.]|nr:cupin domain-containing protein [Pilimelia sp.]